MSHADRIKSYITRPWLKSLEHVRRRCAPSGQYGKKGRKNHLTSADAKYLWFRDKAYLMDKPSIDRKDHRKTYTIENCKFIEYIAQCKEGGELSRRGKVQTKKRSYCKHIYYDRVADIIFEMSAAAAFVNVVFPKIKVEVCSRCNKIRNRKEVEVKSGSGK